MLLNIIWFVLLAVLLTGYAILDGFDLGVGIVHRFTRNDKERRTCMNAIGPVWDGNEVWLITLGGALFAAFPIAYATIFPAFYTPFMLLLCMLIFRAASLELRNKEDHVLWKKTWDFLFSWASTLAALLLGVAAGNCLRGLPIDAEGAFQGNLITFLNPFCLLTGITAVALLGTHGALYLAMKTEGDSQKLMLGKGRRLGVIALILGTLSLVMAFATLPHVRGQLLPYPGILLALLGMAWMNMELQRGRPVQGFIASALTIAGLCLVVAGAMFPNLVISSLDAAYNVTIYNGASSQKTQAIMLLIVCMFLPLVLCYTAWVYWVFRGKVRLDENSY